MGFVAKVKRRKREEDGHYFFIRLALPSSAASFFFFPPLRSSSLQQKKALDRSVSRWMPNFRKMNSVLLLLLAGGIGLRRQKIPSPPLLPILQAGHSRSLGTLEY